MSLNYFSLKDKLTYGRFQVKCSECLIGNREEGLRFSGTFIILKKYLTTGTQSTLHYEDYWVAT